MLNKALCIFEIFRISGRKVTLQVPTSEDFFNKQRIEHLLKELNNLSFDEFYLICEKETIFSYLKLFINNLKCFGKKIILVSLGFDLYDYIDFIKGKIDLIVFCFNECSSCGSYIKGFTQLSKVLEENIPVIVNIDISIIDTNAIDYITNNIKNIGIKSAYFNFLINKKECIEDIFNNRSEDNYISFEKVYKEIEDICDKNEIKMMLDLHSKSNEITGCCGGKNLIHINSLGQIFPCPFIEQSSLAMRFSEKWVPGNLERCLEKNKMFAEINNIRYGVFRYNTCLARASIFSKCNNLLSKDPITEMFK